MLPDRPFSKNFTLHEMLTSQTASRMGFMEQYEPSDKVIANLEELCRTILQPLRDAIKSPVIISSGYRCLRVNTVIGGAARSQHLTGHAADIQDFKNGNEFLLRMIVELRLPFDQLINEFNFDWVHVSYDSNRNRRQVLEAFSDKNFKTRYRPFNV